MRKSLLQVLKVAMSVFRPLLHVVVLMFLGALRISAEATNVSSQLEVAYDSSIATITALPDERRTACLEQLRSTVSSIVAALAAYEDCNVEVDESHSNMILQDIVSAGFQGELFRLVRKARHGDKEALRLIDQRVGAYVRLYPISPKASAAERISLTWFLAKAAAVAPDSVRVYSRARLAGLAEADRLPLLIALASLGDEASQELLNALDSAERGRLQRIFQTFSATGVGD